MLLRSSKKALWSMDPHEIMMKIIHMRVHMFCVLTNSDRLSVNEAEFELCRLSTTNLYDMVAHGQRERLLTEVLHDPFVIAIHIDGGVKGR